MTKKKSKKVVKKVIKKDVPKEESVFNCGGKDTTYKRLKERVKELHESKN